jgi:hypothetical protein
MVVVVELEGFAEFWDITSINMIKLNRPHFGWPEYNYRYRAKKP